MYRNNSLKEIGWLDFQNLSLNQKGMLYQREGRPYHVLISQQFERAMLEQICSLATKIRKIGKTRGGLLFLNTLLTDKRAMLYFAQPSSRTFLSFYSACQIVGIHPAEVRDTATSSEIKGESPEDSVRTFSSYFDLIVMRHPVGGFAERIAWVLSNSDRPIPVVNAGSGKDQHPTQALLDIYTLQRSFENRGGIEGKTIAFVGDLARGRTVRSLSDLLRLYPGVKQLFVAPESLQVGEDILQSLDSHGCPYEVCFDFKKIIPEVDAIYMTRIQDEWDTAEESRLIDTSQYHFKADYLSLLKPDAVLLHPLPRRNEIEVAVDADPRAIYWRQVRNGMWIRAALMLLIFDRAIDIDRYFREMGS